MYCPDCGAEQKEGIKFCTRCGKPLAGASLPATVSLSQPGTQVTSSEQGKQARNIAYAGLIIAAVGVWFIPIIAGIVSIPLGYYAWSKGEKQLGMYAMIAGVVVLVAGVVYFWWMTSQQNVYGYYLPY
jgi:uncharacterized membrane protein YvbJ